MSENPNVDIRNLLETGRRQDAVREIERRMAAEPDHPANLLDRALVETHQGRYGAANATLESVLTRFPGDLRAKAQLVSLRNIENTWSKSAYMKNFRRLREVYRDYPRNIGIETVGRCNAKCGFCPNDALDRNTLAMSDDLFEKLLRDLTAIPAGIPVGIFPNFVNEPFMDRKMLPRLRRINEVLPAAELSLFTNLNALPKGFFDQIANIRNLNHVNVSFNAATEADYKRIMGIDLARTVDNVSRLMALHRDRPFLTKPVILSRVAEGNAADRAYPDHCRRLFAGFEEGRDFVIHVKNRTDWLGGVAGGQSDIPYAFPCGAWFDINVMCTGQVPLCCMDPDGRYGLGDAGKRSLIDIYNDEKFRRYREGEEAREFVDPCKTCSLIN